MSSQRQNHSRFLHKNSLEVSTCKTSCKERTHYRCCYCYGYFLHCFIPHIFGCSFQGCECSVRKCQTTIHSQAEQLLLQNNYERKTIPCKCVARYDLVAIRSVWIAPIMHAKSVRFASITGRSNQGLVHLRIGSGTPLKGHFELLKVYQTQTKKTAATLSSGGLKVEFLRFVRYQEPNRKSQCNLLASTSACNTSKTQ